MMLQAVPAASSEPLLAVDDLVVEYPVGTKIVHAVSGVSLQIARGETLGLVGESGCGKSTLGRAVLQLRRPTAGRVLFDGHDLTTMQGDALRLMRRRNCSTARPSVDFPQPDSPTRPSVSPRAICKDTPDTA